MKKQEESKFVVQNVIENELRTRKQMFDRLVREYQNNFKSWKRREKV